MGRLLEKSVFEENGETYEKVGKFYEKVGIYLTNLVFMPGIYVFFGEIVILSTD